MYATTSRNESETHRDHDRYGNPPTHANESSPTKVYKTTASAMQDFVDFVDNSTGSISGKTTNFNGRLSIIFTSHSKEARSPSPRDRRSSPVWSRNRSDHGPARTSSVWTRVEDDHHLRLPEAPARTSGTVWTRLGDKQRQQSSTRSAGNDENVKQLQATVGRLTSAVAAITAGQMETEHRAKSMKKRALLREDFEYDEDKMGRCRFCNGHHRHRDCPHPSTSLDHDSWDSVGICDEPSGVILGITAIEPEEPDHFNFVVHLIIIFSAIAAAFWAFSSFVVKSIGIDLSTKHPGQSAKSARVVEGVSRCSNKELTPGLTRVGTPHNGFFVDSGASDHICHNEAMFTTLDKTIHKVFRVVHRDNVTGSGMGRVDLSVRTAEGHTTLTLLGVHFVPDQRMSVISVNKCITSAGFDSPDFKKLTWKANDTCTLNMMKTPEGAFVLDCSEGVYVSNRNAKGEIRKKC
jgi:hypothetical protein